MIILDKTAAQAMKAARAYIRRNATTHWLEFQNINFTDDSIHALFTIPKVGNYVEANHWTRVTFRNCKFEWLALKGHEFTSCSFFDCHFYDCSFRNCSFLDCVFRGSEDIRASLFDGCSLKSTRFTMHPENGKQLNFSRLVDCHLWDVSFYYPISDDLNLSGTLMTNTFGFRYFQVTWSGFGEKGRLLTSRLNQNGEVIFSCGCFVGNEKALRNYMKMHPGDTSLINKTRIMALNMAKDHLLGRDALMRRKRPGKPKTKKAKTDVKHRTKPTGKTARRVS